MAGGRAAAGQRSAADPKDRGHTGKVPGLLHGLVHRVTVEADRTVVVRQGSAPGRRQVTGRAAVAGPNPFCVRAGAEIAELGGNAVDVTVAALLAALVTEPGI